MIKKKKVLDMTYAQQYQNMLQEFMTGLTEERQATYKGSDKSK